MNVVMIVPALIVILYAANKSIGTIIFFVVAYFLVILPFFISNRTQKQKISRKKTRAWDFLLVIFPDIVSVLLTIYFVVLIGTNARTIPFLTLMTVASVFNGYKKWKYFGGKLLR